MLLLEKEHRLERILGEYRKVAIAFSGGADSSLLVKKAIEVLGPENVLLLTARSCLLTQNEVDHASSWLSRHDYGTQVQHEFIELQPLNWDEFVQNPPDRCYLCKSLVYKLFVELSGQHGIITLLDGTNDDDMQSTRPGLRALKELDIGTPLAAAGLTKKDVRSLSRELGLDTWNRPSASCLATRIPDGLQITAERIALIEKLESKVAAMGFKGCRVRLDSQSGEKVYIQVQGKNVVEFASAANRPVLIHFFNDSGVKKIFLDLNGR